MSDAIKRKVSGIMKQLVPGFLIAYPTASSRIMRIPAAESGRGWLPDSLPFRMLHIDVDLLRGKRGPQKAFFADFERCVGERQARTRTIDPEKVRFACSCREDAIVGQKHPCER